MDQDSQNVQELLDCRIPGEDPPWEKRKKSNVMVSVVMTVVFLIGAFIFSSILSFIGAICALMVLISLILVVWSSSRPSTYFCVYGNPKYKDYTPQPTAQGPAQVSYMQMASGMAQDLDYIMRAKVNTLELFRPPAEALINQRMTLSLSKAANDIQYWTDVKKSYQSILNTILVFARIEPIIKSWLAEGYQISNWAMMYNASPEIVESQFNEWKSAHQRSELISQNLNTLVPQYPSLFSPQPYQPTLATIRQNLKDLVKVTDAERDADTLLSRIEQDNYTNLKEQVQQIRAHGATPSISFNALDSLRSQKEYKESFQEIQTLQEQLNTFSTLYNNATKVRQTVKTPRLIALYDQGNYQEFIDSVSQSKSLSEQLSLKIDEAKQHGPIPLSLIDTLNDPEPKALSEALSQLEEYRKTGIPNLHFSLDTTGFVLNKWHKSKATVTNTGNAPAYNVNFVISDEVRTKPIEPATVEPGKKVDFEIPLLANTEGEISLDITLKYQDSAQKSYQQTQKLWIQVGKKEEVPIPSTTANAQFSEPAGSLKFSSTPTTTQKSFPAELSDNYRSCEFIGKGGFARVFKAIRKDGKYVAVKIPISMDAVTGKSFIAEMQNWTKLSHPNIVKLYDYNIMPMPYFEEELCDSALAELKKPIECEEAAWIMFNICEGLKFAHAHKIIHRDLKPQNILLKNGVPKISDWGLSRIISVTTTTSAMSFTPYYAAPEQINNRVKDERTDIWQLGVILYEIITGVLPFSGESMIEIGMSIATKDPKPPGEINPEAKVLESVVMKCLQKDPAKRYQSVLELQKDLATYLRQNYTELLKTSVSVQDFTRSASYCGDLVMINMHTGDIPTAYKFLLDLVKYSKGDVKVEAQELSEQIKMRMEEGVTEIPDELIQKAEIIVHQVSLEFRNKG